ncbi:DUF29 domain-containing protein [Prochlorothrix hollandica]|uniref:DUF29 domain-containing protein n=1 Tax=Prochlorothrix hollandica PCC 9006 = CALU 1027 TaxID=317619 RepID=A0A0M2PTQ9_PROHO|nr:DUF29 domain-containing protein [Prochlorothrix hollandica]KKI99880.1 hypothetical protein PROH_08635 [Prochlorothrix hollandica PCC 9006 = CALU 1027]
MNSAPPTSLYDRDILLWVEDTVAKLKAKDFEHLDLENLIEEVESLGISQRNALVSRLMVMLEHLLKRLYVDSPYDYNGWERTIRTQRLEISFLLEDTPSLKAHWEASFTKAWSRALKIVRQDYPDTPFPDEWPFEADLEALLDRPFWQTPP